MPVNKATIDLITEFEGFVGKWYPDPAHGWAVPTCCYGHTDAAGDPKFKNTKEKTFTKAEGAEILVRDLAQYEGYVKHRVKAPLNENQYGALVSFTYNLGPANLAKSTLLKKLNAGDYAGAAKEFPKWNRAGGKVLSGLTRRRIAEQRLFSVDGVAKQTPVEHEPVIVTPLPRGTDPSVNTGGWLSALIQFILSLFKRG